jgi:hypothetical protein
LRLMLKRTDKQRKSKIRARSDSGTQMESSPSTVVRTGLTPKSRKSKPKTKQSSKRVPQKRSHSSRVCSAKRTEVGYQALRARKKRPNPTPRPKSPSKVREILSAPSSLASAAKNH